MSNSYSPHDFQDPFAAGGGVRPRGRGCLWAFLGASLLTFGICSGAVILGFTTLGQSDTSATAERPVLAPQALRDKHAAIAAAFRSNEVGVGEQELHDIKRLLDAVVSACDNVDDVAFRQQVDFDRHWSEIKSCGAMPPISYFVRSVSSWQIRQFMGVPAYWDRYQIVRVEMEPGGETARVYGYCWAGEDVSAVMLWIARDGQRWKLYDWELLEFGIRDSTEWALHIGYDFDPALEEYFAVQNDIDSADDLYAQDETDRAANRIERAEGRNVLSLLRYDAAVQIAYAWLRVGRYREAIDWCETIDNQEAAPGLIYAQAIAYDNLGRPAQALQMAERYESLLGCGPGIWEIQARSLAELGRRNEASDAWRKLLQVDRQNLAALQELGEALADDAKAELADYLQQFDEPAATAVALASRFSSYGDRAGLAAMIDYLRQNAADSGQLHYVLGIEAANDEDYEQAAEHYLRAVEADGENYDYAQSLFYAATQTGDVMAAYEAAPHRDDAFYYFAEIYEDSAGEGEVSHDLMRALVDSHRQHNPNDVWIDYYEAQLLANHEQYAPAEKLLRAALAKTDDEDIRYWLRDQLLATLFDAGDVVRAYQTTQPAGEVFQDLAQRCRWALRWDDLAALVAAHRSSGADDPWLQFYAVLADCRGKSNPQLKTALEEVFEAAGDDESLRSRVREFWLALLAERSADVGDYAAFGEPHAAFDRLAEGLRGYEDWSFLDRLIDFHNVHHSRDPLTTYWRAEYLWAQRAYAELVELLEPQLVDGVLPDKFQDHRSELQQRLVGAYVALGDVERAEARAQKIEGNTPDAVPVLMAALAGGDVEAAIDLASARGISEYSMRSLYEDQVIGEILFSERLAPFRERHPPSIPYDAGRLQIVLLLREAPQLSAQRLGELLAGELGRAVIVEPVTTPAHRGADCWAARDGEHVWAITTSSSRYVDSAEVDPGAISEPMLARLREHTSWIAIEKSQLWPLPTPESTLSTPVIASLLLDENCLAVYFPNHGQRLVDSGGGTYGALRSPIANVMMVRRGERAQLYRDMGEPAKIADQRRALRRDLARRLRTFSTAGTPLDVQIVLQAGAAEELLWVSVQDVERTDYGSQTLHCRLTDSSRLIPKFAAGEPLAVAAYEVVNLRDGE